MKKLLPRLQSHLGLAIAIVFLAGWALAQTGTHQILPGHLRMVLPWWTALLLVCVAMAVARTRPMLAMALPTVLVLAQLVFPYSAGFSGGTDWPIYFGLLVVVLGVSASVAPRWQTVSFVFAIGLAISVAGLLIGWGRLDWSGPLPVIGSDVGAIVVNRILIFAIAFVLSAGAWFVGARSRRWQMAASQDHGPTKANEDEGPVLANRGLKANEESISTLSTREGEIFLLAARGLSNAEIGQTAYISEATAKSHLRNILAKLGLSSRVQLIAFAYDRGLVSPSALRADPSNGGPKR